MFPRTALATLAPVVLGLFAHGCVTAAHADPPPPARPPTSACPPLPAGYAFRIGNDRMTLVPPFTLRAERSHPGAPPTRCAITLSACGGDNTWTADDVTAAVTTPDVTAALGAHAVFGDTSRGVVLVLEHGRDSVTIGGPCRAASAAGACRALPPSIEHLVTVLTGIHRYRLVPPECATL